MGKNPTEKALFKALRKKHGNQGLQIIMAWNHEFPLPKYRDAMRFLEAFPGPNRKEQALCFLTEAAMREFGSTAMTAAYLGITPHAVYDTNKKTFQQRKRMEAK